MQFLQGKQGGDQGNCLGGHSHWKVVLGRAALKTPFFRPNFISGDPPFQAFFPLRSLHLDFLKKFCISRQIFADFQLLRHKFQQKFVPETPVLSKKISSGDPIFESSGSTYLPKILVTTPPSPGGLCDSKSICV